MPPRWFRAEVVPTGPNNRISRAPQSNHHTHTLPGLWIAGPGPAHARCPCPYVAGKLHSLGFPGQLCLGLCLSCHAGQLGLVLQILGAASLALGPGWGPSDVNREQFSLEIIPPSSHVQFKNTSSENDQSHLGLNHHVRIWALNGATPTQEPSCWSSCVLSNIGTCFG